MLGRMMVDDGAAATVAFAKGCLLRDADSCNNLAVMMLDAAGEKRNEAAAVHMFSVACSGGVGIACRNLGAMYANGLGVARDVPRAIDALDEACGMGATNRAGSSAPSTRRGRTPQRGSGCSTTPARRGTRTAARDSRRSTRTGGEWRAIPRRRSVCSRTRAARVPRRRRAVCGVSPQGGQGREQAGDVARSAWPLRAAVGVHRGRRPPGGRRIGRTGCRGGRESLPARLRRGREHSVRARRSPPHGNPRALPIRRACSSARATPATPGAASTSRRCTCGGRGSRRTKRGRRDDAPRRGVPHPATRAAASARPKSPAPRRSRSR